jgi:outer membrane protein OmpA-like peptidoglycan-associated protein
MRTIVIHAVLAGLLGAMSGPPAVAQRAGAVELGVFGRYSIFDDTLDLDEAFGFGGRLGVFLARNVELEAQGSYTDVTIAGTSTRFWNIPGYLRLVYNAPLGARAALLLGAGGVYSAWENAYDDIGANGLLGLRIGLSRAVAIRIDGLVDYVPSPELAGDDNLNFHVQAGLSALLGAEPPRDGDGDGVPDGRDTCPTTAAGERVDAAGCPLDADRDGVSDVRDRCPGTAAGQTVDATGCVPDTDRDGVRDPQDRCPGTPAGTPVDAAGCPPDADRDGVTDGADRCPGTPAGTTVDAAGCPRDSDGDGVSDQSDRCPSTPAGAIVSADGCPSDADGDGVPDGLDRCPATAAGARVDTAGCPVLFAPGARSLILEGVTFATGRADLTPAARAVLDRVAGSLIGNPTVTVEVAGHTDNTGTRATNLRLSQERANSVRGYLIRMGVPAEQVRARGYGPDQPVADNATAAGRAQNRRVELKRTDQ